MLINQVWLITQINMHTYYIIMINKTIPTKVIRINVKFFQTTSCILLHSFKLIILSSGSVIDSGAGSSIISGWDSSDNKLSMNSFMRSFVIIALMLWLFLALH